MVLDQVNSNISNNKCLHSLDSSYSKKTQKKEKVNNSGYFLEQSKILINKIHLIVLRCFQNFKTFNLKIGHQFQAALFHIKKINFKVHFGNVYKYFYCKKSSISKRGNESLDKNKNPYLYKAGDSNSCAKKSQPNPTGCFPGKGNILGSI